MLVVSASDPTLVGEGVVPLLVGLSRLGDFSSTGGTNTDLKSLPAQVISHHLRLTMGMPWLPLPVLMDLNFLVSGKKHFIISFGMPCLL